MGYEEQRGEPIQMERKLEKEEMSNREVLIPSLPQRLVSDIR